MDSEQVVQCSVISEPVQFPEQDENGIDLSLLRENLKVTQTHRMEKHQRALRMVLEMRRAGRQAGLIDNLP